MVKRPRENPGGAAKDLAKARKTWLRVTRITLHNVRPSVHAVQLHVSARPVLLRHGETDVFDVVRATTRKLYMVGGTCVSLLWVGR